MTNILHVAYNDAVPTGVFYAAVYTALLCLFALSIIATWKAFMYVSRRDPSLLPQNDQEFAGLVMACFILLLPLAGNLFMFATASVVSSLASVVSIRMYVFTTLLWYTEEYLLDLVGAIFFYFVVKGVCGLYLRLCPQKPDIV